MSYENDSLIISYSFYNNSIKLFTCSLCKNKSSVLKKKSIYTKSNFLCLNCWNKFYNRLKEIY